MNNLLKMNMSKDKIQAIINVLQKTLEANMKPNVADEMVTMAIAALEDEKAKII